MSLAVVNLGTKGQKTQGVSPSPVLSWLPEDGQLGPRSPLLCRACWAQDSTETVVPATRPGCHAVTAGSPPHSTSDLRAGCQQSAPSCSGGASNLKGSGHRPLG